MSADHLLRPWQVPHKTRLIHALKAYGRVVDNSDTGTGKTFTALATAKDLGIVPFVVCPLAAKPQWDRAARYLGVPAEIVHWEQAKGRRRGEPEERKLTETKWLEEKAHGEGSYVRWKQNYGLMVFDEIQRATGMTTLESKMVIAAHRQAKYVMGLSATVGETPLHFKAVGYLLSLHANNKPRTRWVDPLTKEQHVLLDFRNWVQRYGCRPGFFGGFTFTHDKERQRECMDAVRAACGDRLVGMSRVDIPGFPKTLIEPWLVPGSSEGELVSAGLREVAERIADLKRKEEETESAMEEQTRLRQRLELLKLPGMLEIALDAIEQGRKAAIFLNYTESIDRLHEMLNGHAPALIYDGRQELDEKRQVQRSFQSGPAKAIVVQSKAGGTGLDLHDPDGVVERDVQISPLFSGRDLSQIFGRCQRDGGAFSRQRIILMQDTDEDRYIYPALKQKCLNLSALNDGLTFEDGEVQL